MPNCAIVPDSKRGQARPTVTRQLKCPTSSCCFTFTAECWGRSEIFRLLVARGTIQKKSLFCGMIFWTRPPKHSIACLFMSHRTHFHRFELLGVSLAFRDMGSPCGFSKRRPVCCRIAVGHVLFWMLWLFFPLACWWFVWGCASSIIAAKWKGGTDELEVRQVNKVVSCRLHTCVCVKTLHLCNI